MLEILGLSYWMWFGTAVFLTIIELLLGGSFFLIGIAFSASVLGVLLWAMPNLLWQYQLLIFSFISIFGTVLWKQYCKKYTKQKHKDLNRKSEQYMGKIFTLVEPLENGLGRVKIGDSVWQASGPDLPRGTKVKVTGMEGIILAVVKAEK